MLDIGEMVRYKLRRVRDLARPSYVRWRFLKRFRADEPLVAQVEGVTIQYLPVGNVSRDLYLGQFERDVVEFLSEYLKPGMVVVDVGANIGIYSMLSAKCVGPRGTVHAFEPTPESFAQLRTNVELNKFSCLRLNQLALADEAGTSTLYLYEQNAMNSLSQQDWVGKALGQVVVNTNTLDEYLLAENVRQVDLLKIDAEGAEMAVLKGAEHLLSGPHSPVVVCEFTDKTTRNFGYRAAELREHLEKLGYNLFRWNVKSKRLIPEPMRQNYEIYANIVCIKPTRSS